MNLVEVIQQIVKNVISDTVNIQYLTCKVESVSPLKFVTDNRRTILEKQVVFTDAVNPKKFELELQVPIYSQYYPSNNLWKEQDNIMFTGCKGHDASAVGLGTSDSFKIRTKKEKFSIDLNKKLEVGETVILQKLNSQYLFIGRAGDPYKEIILKKEDDK